MTLRCELSKAGVAVEWRRDAQLLKEGDKYQMRQEGRVAEMTVQHLALTDAGEYSCCAGATATSADIKVRGETPALKHEKFPQTTILHYSKMGFNV